MFDISEDYFRDRESEACLDMAQLDVILSLLVVALLKEKKI